MRKHHRPDGSTRNRRSRRIGALQLGNVVGDRTGMIRFEFLVAAVQKALERRLRGIAGVSGRDIDKARANYLGVHVVTLNNLKQSNSRATTAACSGYSRPSARQRRASS